MSATTGRLINVSNRLPVVIKKQASGPRVERSSGGLATALDSVWRQEQGVWIGWAGTTQNQEVEELVAKASRPRAYRLKPVSLSEDEVAKFYSGFANEIIWPLFHDMPSRCNFDPDYWEIYQRVNQKFAKAIMDSVRDNDFVWVHDYHLMLTAHYLREAGIKARVGFFLHIPFPAPDMFEKLPWSEPVLLGLLDYDLVGFQTDRDRMNFLNCLERKVKDGVVEPRQSQAVVTRGSHRTTVGTFPISIDFEGISELAARPEIASRASLIRRDLLENTLVLGVDRLDYTKGIPERLKAFLILLQKFPELRGKITLVQVVVPSREDIPRYKDLRTELELLVSRINGEFTQAGWVPIHYMHRNLGREELLAYYRAADIALITPLKDGMNLVAKEFCAAQTDERGVLVLSEFAGAGPELRQGALLVNPNDFAGVAQAIHDAYEMPIDEKRTRMRLLRDLIRRHNVQCWAQSFIQAATRQDEAPKSEPAGPQIVRASQPPDIPGVALVAANIPHYMKSRSSRHADRRVV